MFGIGTIIVFLAVLSILVLAHEIGHFITAKRLGCQVEEFGIGFPPRLWAWKKSKSGVVYSLNWIPLGGFVRIKGESGSQRGQADSFSSKPIWKRFLILVAGVAMNFLLTVVLLSVGYLIGAPTAVDQTLPVGARVSDQAVRVTAVLTDSPAEAAGLFVGDEVLMINGQSFADAALARNFIGEHIDQELSFLIRRDEAEQILTMKPAYLPEPDQIGVGAGLITTGFVSFPIHLAIWHGLTSTVEYAIMIVLALLTILKSLLLGQGVGMELSGPVGIAVMTGQVARLGVAYLLQFTAILSINLAIINILPLPALDGGRILFLLIEKVRRQPVSEKIEAVAHNIGFLFLIGLIILITCRDLLNYGGQIWEGFVNN